MYTPAYKPHKTFQAIVPFLVLLHVFLSTMVLVFCFLPTGREGRKCYAGPAMMGTNNGRLSDVLDEVMPLL